MYKKFVAIWLCLCLAFPSVLLAEKVNFEEKSIQLQGESEEVSETETETENTKINENVKEEEKKEEETNKEEEKKEETKEEEEKEEEKTSNYTVVSGDSLMKIASRYLGSADRWTELVELNKDKYPSLGSNPNLIYPGWDLTLPGDSTAPASNSNSSNSSSGSNGVSNVSYLNTESPGLSNYTGGKLPKAQFIALFGPVARDSMKATGVPASVTLAQAILETGWGSSSIGDAKNLFGIKGTGPAGSTLVHTQECYNGQYTTIKAGFRKYYSWQQSIDDHANLVSKGRYKSAWDNFQATKNADEFARGIHKAGYATSPTYSSDLIKLMQQNNLYEWDKID